MVEKRTIEQTKIYFLVMNDMRSAQIENAGMAAWSDDKEKLVAWYNEQLDGWRDGDWGKAFRKDSPLEWRNPVNLEKIHMGQGLFAQWIDDIAISKMPQNLQI